MIDVDDTTYLLMHGEMDSTDDIMEAVEQEQEHRFHNYRVLIHEIESLRAEVKRLREENKRYRNRLLETHSWSELRALEEEEE